MLQAKGMLMKVLHVYKDYLPTSFGGAEQVIHILAQEMPKSGIEADVVTTVRKDGRSETMREVAVGNHRSFEYIRNFDRFSTPMSWRMARDFRRLARGYDLLHFHYPWPFMDLLQMRAPDIPYVVTYHSDIVKQKHLLWFYGPLMRRFLNGGAAVVATSERYVETSDILPRLRSRVEVVHLGMYDPLQAPAPTEPVRDEIAAIVAPGQAPYFLFLGVHRYYKGLEYAVRAAQRIRTRLIVAGDGPERAKLQALAVELGADNIRFIGQVNDAEKDVLLKGCLSFVFPSCFRSEAFGLSLVEAAAHSKPMVCCEIGTGTTLVNRDGETGIVVPPADDHALAEALKTLEQDADMVARYGRNARARFESHFKGETMAAKYATIYRDILG